MTTPMQDDQPQHINTSPELWAKLKPLAREMRHEPTPAEDYLWKHVRNRRIQDAKFRRQYAIERFIVDFYCIEAKLVIEVDGNIHDYTQSEDAVRQEFLESRGLKVVRFTNGEVLQQIGAVCERIGEVLLELLPRY